jgi:hypothetical protein
VDINGCYLVTVLPNRSISVCSIVVMMKCLWPLVWCDLDPCILYAWLLLGNIANLYIDLGSVSIIGLKFIPLLDNRVLICI